VDLRAENRKLINVDRAGLTSGDPSDFAGFGGGRKMKIRGKWIFCALVVMVAITAVSLRLLREGSVERHLLRAGHTELTGWSSYWDGGSRSFAFELPGSHSMVVFVPHRITTFGGNSDFQEIWLGNDAEMQQTLLIPGSALETRLLALLQTATVKANRGTIPTNWPWTPTPGELKWLATRIQDRKSKW
jgi:hypothetical protein